MVLLLLLLLLLLGGSNFRVLKITLKPEADIVQIDKKMTIDTATKQSTQEKLFDFIAQSMADFVKEHKIKEKLPLGFTFSFPVHQTSLISGTIMHWFITCLSNLFNIRYTDTLDQGF